MTKTAVISTILGASLALSACSASEENEADFTLDVMNAAGEKIGTLELESEDFGYTEIEVKLSGLEPGTHAMHFHEFGKCEGPDYSSAGGHYNPTGVSHGKVGDGPHAGDMMNIEIGSNGSGTFEVVNERVTVLPGGDLPALMDADGSALIIHAKADDYESQPSGAAGARIACAVIPPA